MTKTNFNMKILAEGKSNVQVIYLPKFKFWSGWCYLTLATEIASDQLFEG